MRAEILLRRNLFGATRTETFGPMVEVLEPGDAITRNCEWGPTLMIVQAVGAADDGIGRVVTMTGWSNTIVPDPEDGFLDLPADTGPVPTAATRTLQVPGFDVQQLQRVTGGNEEPFGRATWTLITDPNCDQVIIRAWPTAVPAEVETFTADARLANAKIIGPLRPTTEYTVVASLTRRDLRRTYDTDPDTFTTGAFRPGEIGPDDLTDELNASRSYAARSIEQIMADHDAMVAQLADAVLGRVVDQQQMRTEVVARFQATEASYTQAINVVAGELGALATETTNLRAAYEASTATFTGQISTISTSLGVVAAESAALSATVNDPVTGLAATANTLSLFSAEVTSDLSAISASVTAVEAEVDDVSAGGIFAMRVVAASSGWHGAIELGLRGAPGVAADWTGMIIERKNTGETRIIMDADTTVMRGVLRDATGKTYINWDTGAWRSST